LHVINVAWVTSLEAGLRLVGRILLRDSSDYDSICWHATSLINLNHRVFSPEVQCRSIALSIAASEEDVWLYYRSHIPKCFLHYLLMFSSITELKSLNSLHAIAIALSTTLGEGLLVIGLRKHSILAPKTKTRQPINVKVGITDKVG
jgi:hypothetical protein